MCLKPDSCRRCTVCHIMTVPCCRSQQPSSRRAQKAATKLNQATADSAAVERERNEADAFFLSSTGRSAPGVANRVMAVGGEACDCSGLLALLAQKPPATGRTR